MGKREGEWGKERQSEEYISTRERAQLGEEGRS